ncbi:hypothetical protein C8R44DRAFT_873095 [Mycena epipterygia]|nr:hypothetical protein C8R44DRAFT_873095 [Mycena epipterygia]
MFEQAKGYTYMFTYRAQSPAYYSRCGGIGEKAVLGGTLFLEAIHMVRDTGFTILALDALHVMFQAGRMSSTKRTSDLSTTIPTRYPFATSMSAPTVKTEASAASDSSARMGATVTPSTPAASSPSQSKDNHASPPSPAAMTPSSPAATRPQGIYASRLAAQRRTVTG